MTPPKLITGLLLLGTLGASAQPADTLSQVRAAAYRKDFDAANRLLQPYNQAHRDLYGRWLQAQVLYWQQENARSIGLYRELLRQYPGETALALDYARTLWETGSPAEAETVLNPLLAKQPNNSGARLLEAYLRFDDGDPHAAGIQIDAILKADPRNEEAIAFRRRLQESTAVTTSPEAAYFNDSQGLTGGSLTAEIGSWKNALLSPSLKAGYYQITDSTGFGVSGLQLQLANNFRINYGQTTLRLQAGLNAVHSVPQMTLGLAFRQRASRYFTLEIEAARLPYLYTPAAIRNGYLFVQAGGALSMNLNDRFTGKAGYRQDFFGSSSVYNAYGWLMAPPLRAGRVSIRGGYAFSYATAEESTFEGLQRPEAFATGHGVQEAAPGAYALYFTPRNQAVHSLFARLTAKLPGDLGLEAGASAGIQARADIPYLLLAQKSGQYYYERGFVTRGFTPFDISMKFSKSAGRRSTWFLSAQHASAVFYNRSSVTIGWLYKFIR